MNVKLRFVKLSANAKTPTRGSEGAVGYDLYSAYDYIIPSKGKCLCKTDIVLATPDGCYGRIAPRSGLAVNYFIDVGAGVIDRDYRGNVAVLLFNFGNEEYRVVKQHRIAQIILERVFTAELQECDYLEETQRNSSGFGSTGV